MASERSGKDIKMQKYGNFLVSLLIFLGFSAIGIAIGYSIGTKQADRHREGASAYWTAILASVRFEKIIDATSDALWAQSIDGKLYSYMHRCGSQPECEKWIEIKEMPADIHQYYNKPQISPSCPPPNLKYFTEPPRNVIECARVKGTGMDVFVPATTTYFALLDTGSIWIWEFNYSPIDDVATIFLYTALGFIVAVIMFVYFNKYLAMRKKRPR